MGNIKLLTVQCVLWLFHKSGPKDQNEKKRESYLLQIQQIQRFIPPIYPFFKHLSQNRKTGFQFFGRGEIFAFFNQLLEPFLITLMDVLHRMSQLLQLGSNLDDLKNMKTGWFRK